MLRKIACDEKKDDLSSQIAIEKLFDTSRIQKFNLMKTLIYFPFGVLLLMVRLVVSIVGFMVISSVHPSSSKRNAILNGIYGVLGYNVELNGTLPDNNTKILIANHVSILDRLAVNVLLPCHVITNDFQLSNVDSLSFWKDVDFHTSRELSSSNVDSLKSFIESSSVHILTFPEGAITNGKAGLLKFHPGIFSLNLPVQPIVIYISSSTSFMIVSPSVLGSLDFVDFLWSLFLPCTYFTIKFLPIHEKLAEESVLDFSKRVSMSIANAANISSTVFTASDKRELMKKLQKGGLYNYFFMSNNFESQSSSSQLLQSDNIETLNMAATSFGKTPKERMLSYQQRRELLMETARRKYLEKHNC